MDYKDSKSMRNMKKSNGLGSIIEENGTNANNM